MVVLTPQERERYELLVAFRNVNAQSASDHLAGLTDKEFKSAKAAAKKVEAACNKIVEDTAFALNQCTIKTPGCLATVTKNEAVRTRVLDPLNAIFQMIPTGGGEFNPKEPNAPGYAENIGALSLLLQYACELKDLEKLSECSDGFLGELLKKDSDFLKKVLAYNPNDNNKVPLRTIFIQARDRRRQGGPARVSVADIQTERNTQYKEFQDALRA